MSELKNYLLDDYRDTCDYLRMLTRSGLTSFPPMIITCAITGGMHGAEANPNLPELIDDQVQQVVDAYNAGASMVHIHRRQPNSPKDMSQSADEYLEINARVREKCPDIIINNTCMGGRIHDVANSAFGPLAHSCLPARPEVASFDITNFAVRLKRPPRKPPLFGRDTETVDEMLYTLLPSEAETFAKLCNEYDIKPEFEMFDIGNIRYLEALIQQGLVTPPYWSHVLFNGNGTYPSIDMMLAVTRTLPRGTLLSVIGIGAAQFPVITVAMIMGHHVRVGMEDNVFIGKGKLAESNAQLVEKIVRIANELERPIATPAQAREMMGLGAPRQYEYNK